MKTKDKLQLLDFGDSQRQFPFRQLFSYQPNRKTKTSLAESFALTHLTTSYVKTCIVCIAYE
jgi:hypothetical protein